MNDKSREGFAPLDIGAVPLVASVYQARWPGDGEELYRNDVAEWRCNLVREINSRLAALEAPEAEQVATLQQRLADVNTKRLAAERERDAERSAHKYWSDTAQMVSGEWEATKAELVKARSALDAAEEQDN